MKSWTGQTALVTGASSGIGRAIALELALDGVEVCLLARRRQQLLELKNEIELAGGRARIAVVDLLSDEGLEEAKKLAAEVDLLINNAGFGMNGRFVEADPERLRAMFRLDLEVPQILARVAAKSMIGRGRGGILNVASIAALVPTPFHATYSALKSALLVFSESLRLELRHHRIKVTTLCPGVTDTEFFDAGAYVKKSLIYRMPRSSPVDVARAGLKGLEKNACIVVPGLKNKALLMFVRLVPRTFLVKSAGWTMKTD